MLIILPNTSVVTQINVFTVPPDRQQPPIDQLARATTIASEVDGWISASLHRSLDGTRVVNYAQSVDEAAARQVIGHLIERGLIDANAAYGTAHPGLYEVVYTFDRTG